MIDRVALEAAIARAIGIYMVHGVSVREAASGATDEAMRLVGDRVLVPREPTKAMCQAGWHFSSIHYENLGSIAAIYRAMISASTPADGRKDA